MNKNSDSYELSVWILNICLMNRRIWCECYRQGSGSHEIASILLEIVWQLHYICPWEKRKNQGEWKESV